ncbi:hypothetical protein BGY98DRAFT_1007343, partial [Russula aff. rugulosa BPL654]
MLKNIRKLYIALHPTSSTPQTAFNTTEDSKKIFNTTEDWEQILDNSEFYLICAEEDHRSSSSFPNLQYAPPTLPVAPTQPVLPTRSVAPTPSIPRFPEPHTPTHNTLSSLLGQPPSPGFPDENRYIPANGMYDNRRHLANPFNRRWEPELHTTS